MGACEACERCNVITRGAKCALHESSTSPSIDRLEHARGERPWWDRPGSVGIGRVPFVLAGGDLAKLTPKARTEMRAAILGVELDAVDDDGEWYLLDTGKPIAPLVTVPSSMPLAERRELVRRMGGAR